MSFKCLHQEHSIKSRRDACLQNQHVHKMWIERSAPGALMIRGHKDAFVSKFVPEDISVVKGYSYRPHNAGLGPLGESYLLLNGCMSCFQMKYGEDYIYSVKLHWSNEASPCFRGTEGRKEYCRQLKESYFKTSKKPLQVCLVSADSWVNGRLLQGSRYASPCIPDIVYWHFTLWC